VGELFCLSTAALKTMEHSISDWHNSFL